jgi:hypothetical protein
MRVPKVQMEKLIGGRQPRSVRGGGRQQLLQGDARGKEVKARRSSEGDEAVRGKTGEDGRGT